MKKKGFTLIELMIVIVIIGFLIGTWMRLNWWSLEKLRAKSAAEEVSSFFDTTFLQIQASNYENWKAYTGIDLTLNKGTNFVPYEYHLNNENHSIEEENITWEFGWDFTITDITWDNTSLESVKIKYIPFHPNCNFETTPSWTDINKVYFSVKPKGLKKACFEIDYNYCKLKTITCEEDRIEF